MKKITILIIIVIVMVVATGCTGTPDTYTDDSLSTESSSVIARETPEDLKEKDEEEKKEEEGMTETDVFIASERATEAPTAGERSKTAPTTKSSTPSLTNSDPPRLPTASSTPPAPPPSSAEPTAPVYTQQDYDDIIAAVRHYAENEITKIKFVWDPTIKMDEFHGWHGTPQLNSSEKDGVIRTLKYHADLTADVLTDQANGMPSHTVYYNIVRYEVENMFFFEQPCVSIFFALVYG